MLNVVYLATEKAVGQALELFRRIGDVEAEGTMLRAERSSAYSGPSTAFGHLRVLTSLRMTL